MQQTRATILIPDISGFTEFITSTELTHGSMAINFLIDAIVTAVGDAYEVSEIEGDAVLLVRKEQSPSKQEITDTCIKIFNAFHFQRKWMQQHMLCPCRACLGIKNLTLKFVAHHGPLAQITVGRFTKHSGPGMIIAHRLLKNSISHDEYLLMTETLLEHATDASASDGGNWGTAEDEFSSIGKVGYHFRLLSDAHENVPDPPPLDNAYFKDDTAYHMIAINTDYKTAYMALMHIPGRGTWQPGLHQVEQEMPAVFVGSVHRCVFEDFTATVSPLQMQLSDDRILFAEHCQIEGTDCALVHEYVFENTGSDTCMFWSRMMTNRSEPLAEDLFQKLLICQRKMADGLKEYCEQTERFET